MTPEPGQSAPVDAAPSRSLRILVVEDGEDTRAALRTFFDLLGHQAHLTANVSAALAAAREQAFDVLLCDIGLPDGTGWELLRALRRSAHPPVHAIAMSGYGLDSHLGESAAAGFDLHLVKPFDPGALERVLNGYRAAR